MPYPHDYPTGPVDASGEPADLEQVIPPEQPPMDDAAGGPDVSDEASTEDLSVQNGD